MLIPRDTSHPEIYISLGQMDFGQLTRGISPSVRTCQDARPYLRDEIPTDASGALYWMYRDAVGKDERAIFQHYGIRHDLTVIRPGQVGLEYVKTVGHYHPAKPGSFATYPEVYELLSGRAVYLLQRPNEDLGCIADVLAIRAQAGDKVLVPPGYGHVTINIGDNYLVMANLVAAEFTSVYGSYQVLRGAAYYLTKRNRKEVWEQNPNYRVVPELRQGVCKPMPELGLRPALSLYEAFLATPHLFSYLIEPSELYKRV